MTDGLVLGIDLGTTSLKAALFAADGRQVWAHAAPNPIRRAPGGLAEQDAEDWLALVRDVLVRVAAAGLAPAVQAVGLTSQVNTHVFVDAAGRPLAPAILWQDSRAAAAATRLDAGITAQQRLGWWGAPLPVDASHALARMAWMAETQPALWAQTDAVLLPKDYLIRALTGARISDPLSNIGLVGADLAYIGPLTDLVPGAAGRLMRLSPPASVAGGLRLAPGLAEVPVAVGTMDALAGMFGLGLRAEGDAAYLSGTSEVLAIASEAAVPQPGVMVFPRHEGLRLHVGPTQSGGASVEWFCRAFGVTPGAMAEEVAADPGSEVPLFLPHLAGERAPLWDAGAQGAFIGLTAGMGRAALARGVYQGVAFSARLLLGALEASAARRPEVMLCGGGGFRSDVWNRIRADVLGLPLRRLAVPDPGLLGAAAIAAVAAGLHRDLAAALAEVVRYDRVYEPDPRRQAEASRAFERYLPTYAALRGLRQGG